MHQEKSLSLEEKRTLKESNAAFAHEVQMKGLMTHFKISCSIPADRPSSSPKLPPEPATQPYGSLSLLDVDRDAVMTAKPNPSRFFAPKESKKEDFFMQRTKKKRCLKKRKQNHRNKVRWRGVSTQACHHYLLLSHLQKLGLRLR